MTNACQKKRDGSFYNLSFRIFSYSSHPVYPQWLQASYTGYHLCLLYKACSLQCHSPWLSFSFTGHTQPNKPVKHLFFFLIDANLFTTGIKTQEMQVWSLGHEDHLEWGFSRYVVSNSWDLMYCSPPGFSLHGISQARILEWVAISFSRGSSPPRNRNRVSSISGRFFTNWARREADHLE